MISVYERTHILVHAHTRAYHVYHTFAWYSLTGVIRLHNIRLLSIIFIYFGTMTSASIDDHLTHLLYVYIYIYIYIYIFFMYTYIYISCVTYVCSCTMYTSYMYTHLPTHVTHVMCARDYTQTHTHTYTQ